MTPDPGTVDQWARRAAGSRGAPDPGGIHVHQEPGPEGTVVVYASWPSGPRRDGSRGFSGVADDHDLTIDPTAALGRLLAAWEGGRRETPAAEVARLAAIVLAYGDDHLVAMDERDVADLGLPPERGAGPPSALPDGIQFWWETRSGAHRVRIRAEAGTAVVEED